MVCLTLGYTVAFRPVLTVIGVSGALFFAAFCSENRLKWMLFGLAIYTPFEMTVLNFFPKDVYFLARFGPYIILAICFLYVLVRRFVLHNYFWIKTPIDIPLFLFVVWSGISLILNKIPITAALFAYQPLLRFVILAFYFIQFINFDENASIQLMKTMFFVVLLVSFIAIAQSYIGYPLSNQLAPAGREFMGYVVGSITQTDYGSYFHVFSTLGRYNNLGAFLGFFLVFTFPFFLSKKKPRLWLGLFYCVVLPVLVLAAARAPWIGLFAGLLAIFAMRSRLKLVLISIVFVIILSVSLPTIKTNSKYIGGEYGTALERLLEPFSERYLEVSRYNYGRLFWMVEFPKRVLLSEPKHFFIGYGPGSLGRRAVEIHGLFPLLDLGVESKGHHLINDVSYAYIFGQVGIIGLALFGWISIRLFFTAFKAYRQTNNSFIREISLSYISILVYFFVMGFFYPIWEIRHTSLYFWLFGGIVLKLSRQVEQHDIFE